MRYIKLVFPKSLNFLREKIPNPRIAFSPKMAKERPDN